MTKTVIICGAGATLSEAVNRTSAKRPPLDRGFFSQCKRLRVPEYNIIHKYVKDAFGTDISNSADDSLERVMAILYADLLNAATSTEDAAAAFRAILRLIHRRIAETTNGVIPGKKSNLYRIVRQLLLKEGIAPTDISFITFNYDLTIERTLSALQKSSSIKKDLRPLMTFPYCYRLTGYQQSSPPKASSKFFSWGTRFCGMEILKLHGSLNWFSVHESNDPHPTELIKKDHNLWITPREKVDTGMTIKIGKLRRFTFPIIVPPVVNKSAIFHNSLGEVWRRAHTALSQARSVIVFGYSCPQADQESANLISRTLKTSSQLAKLSIIDPSTNAFDRFAHLSNADTIHYFRSAHAYLDQT